MRFFSRLRDRLVSWLFDWLGIDEAAARIKDPGVYLASCWGGPNAGERMMNILSPNMSEATYNARVASMKARGANTAHVFLINKGDGEAAGYSPWGASCGPVAGHPCDRETVELMRTRILALRRKGFCVVPWIIADDSSAWAKKLFRDPDEIVRAMVDADLIEDTSPMVVLGLEMDEYGSATQWETVAMALRHAGYAGRIGVHHTSGRAPFASIGSVVFGQLPPDCNARQIASQIRHIRASGREAVGFEYSRHPDREKAQAALDAGAIGVGNW